MESMCIAKLIWKQGCESTLFNVNLLEGAYILPQINDAK